MLKSKLTNAAGNRNNWVTVERATDADANDSYEVLPEWSLLCGRWAETLITSGYEFTQAMQQNELIRAILKLPYDSVTATISNRDRIQNGGMTWNIDTVFNDGMNNEKMVLWLISGGE